MRKSDICLACLAALSASFVIVFFHAWIGAKADAPRIEHMAGLVRSLELTDLCLFTEARYTRHLSQADLHSAFQDHPMSLEHFPAGSMAGPPAHLRR